MLRILFPKERISLVPVDRDNIYTRAVTPAKATPVPYKKAFVARPIFLKRTFCPRSNVKRNPAPAPTRSKHPPKRYTPLPLIPMISWTIWVAFFSTSSYS
eukprot:TRINITY_DN2806_c0_g1_i2.p1 TRINITY_DN2806_c0_g1~~TRINITY_DN2806_c0_g1_i2.p1  ORF type:complete len:100 (+),score=4.91 TRINITY_DN2806_c0_g1_i2:163-462(+)